MVLQFKKNLPGVLLCFFIAVPAWFLGKSFPVVGSPVFGILIGMILTMVLPALAEAESHMTSGVRFTSKKLLQLSIILLGFGMNLFHVFQVGGQSLFVMLFTLSGAFAMAYLVGKALKMEGKMTILIGVGTAICGGSAIAASAPVIQAEDEDVAHAISTIFLFNILAVFLFPPLGRMLAMSDMGFGLWAGTAINDTSSVVAAGTAWSNAAGNNTALTFATIVKLTRTLMIVPITLVLAIHTARKAKNAETGSRFSFVKVFPWFVIGFVGAAMFNTFIAMPEISGVLVEAGKFLIVMAMSAIGLNTHLKKLIANGTKPVVLGVCCWAAVAGISLVVQTVTRAW